MYFDHTHSRMILSTHTQRLLNHNLNTFCRLEAKDYQFTNLDKTLNHDIIDHKNTPHLASSQGHFRPALTVHPSLCLFVHSDNWCTTLAYNVIS